MKIKQKKQKIFVKNPPLTYTTHVRNGIVVDKKNIALAIGDVIVELEIYLNRVGFKMLEFVGLYDDGAEFAPYNAELDIMQDGSYISVQAYINKQIDEFIESQSKNQLRTAELGSYNNKAVNYPVIFIDDGLNMVAYRKGKVKHLAETDDGRNYLKVDKLTVIAQQREQEVEFFLVENIDLANRKVKLRTIYKDSLNGSIIDEIQRALKKQSVNTAEPLIA